MPVQSSGSPTCRAEYRQWLHSLHASIATLCLSASTMLWPAGQSNRQALELRKACQLNTSMCLLQLQRWGEVVPECNAVISVEPQNRKALYRRGQALHALGRCRGNACPAYVTHLASAASHQCSAVVLLLQLCLQGLLRYWAGSCQERRLVVVCTRLCICRLCALLCMNQHANRGFQQKKLPDR